MTQNFISQLRGSPQTPQTREEPLASPSDPALEEVGRLALSYQLTHDTLDAQIYEENRALERHYFDPYLKDKAQIESHCREIEKLLKAKGDALD